MVKHKDILKVMSIIPITFFRKYNLLLLGIGMGKELPVAELFLQNIFSGNPSRKETDVIVAMFGLLETVIFGLLFGSFVYHDLYENSSYIFIRQNSRKGWFTKKSAELFIFSAVYNFLFLGLTFLLCICYSSQSVDFVAVKMFAFAFILLTLFTFWTTMLINIVAVFKGAAISFIINYVILTIFSSIATDFESIPVLNRFPILLKLNPVASVTINWDDSMGRGMQSAAYFVVLCILTYVVGSILISRIDISIENRE